MLNSKEPLFGQTFASCVQVKPLQVPHEQLVSLITNVSGGKLHLGLKVKAAATGMHP